ncbi:galactose-3-O-sulfotransferase 2-like [Mercenaria mercenaria]|uniref:galactose-3-O-sulfotransferase 2-like n=1 Tax=Mercenaria mercenaria TaxID=6596 RepID=UPI00234FB30A|nr:galactose-3-O-sulfotransferase 2-like [Mercenaria mercenaria]
MSGIFFRFGIRHNLTFALPRTGVVLNSMNDLVTKNKDGRFDILAVHALTKELFDRLLNDDVIQLAVVRHPLKRMISAAYFYRDLALKNHRTNYLNKVPQKDFIHNLINKPELYEDNANFTLTRNAMGKRFGFSPSTQKNDTGAIKKQLDSLNKEFNLVLVTERLDESLVLMKRTLNWTFNDILYVSKNVHSHERVNISETEEEKYRDASFLDYAIYDYFTDILDRKITSEGAGFIDEVTCFKNILLKVSRFCERKSSSRLTIEKSKWNTPFQLWRDDCRLMSNGNPQIIANLRNKIKRRK